MTGPKAVTEEEEEQLGSDEPESIPGAGAARSCRRGQPASKGGNQTFILFIFQSHGSPKKSRVTEVHGTVPEGSGQTT